MLSSEIRAEARRNLTGRWGKAALLTLGLVVISAVLSLIQNVIPNDIVKAILSIAVAIIEVPIAYGFMISLVKFYKGEDVGFFDFVTSGFANFARAWKVSLWMLVKMLIPVVILIVAYVLMGIGAASTVVSYYSGASVGGGSAMLIIGTILSIVAYVWLIIKSYAYQLSTIVAIENPDLLAKESVEKCAELMKGKKGKLFFLELSFIGWAFLAGLTFGIGSLWLIPYMFISMIIFYHDIAGTGKSVETKAEVKEEGPVQ